MIEFGALNANRCTGHQRPGRGANPGAKEAQKTLSTAPGQLRVIKRNGAVVAYDESKISVAITKAYLAVEGGTAAASSRIHESVAQLSSQITDIFKRRMPSGGTIHIEDIQDQVELALMRTGEHKIARSYVIYRADRTRMREQQAELQQPKKPSLMSLLKMVIKARWTPQDCGPSSTKLARAWKMYLLIHL